MFNFKFDNNVHKNIMSLIEDYFNNADFSLMNEYDEQEYLRWYINELLESYNIEAITFIRLNLAKLFDYGEYETLLKITNSKYAKVFKMIDRELLMKYMKCKNDKLRTKIVELVGTEWQYYVALFHELEI